MAQTPIIVKKIKKGGHAHHGGAWKVAYADFVTAMMAFFLLLWLLNAVTEEQLNGIADYFAPTMVSKSSSTGADGALGGQALDEGAMRERTSAPSISMDLPPATLTQDGEDLTEPQEGISEDQFLEAMADREEQQFEKAKESLEQAVRSIPELAKMANSLLVDNTPEGLRVQLIDQEGLALFPRGSANMYGHTRAMLELVSRIVMQLPQKVSISGHTDATKFADQSNYTNWELSADRALAARRLLTMAGVPEARIDRVVGKAATDPLIADDPTNAQNRRLSIIMLREADLQPKTATLDELRNGDDTPAPPAAVPPPTAAPAGKPAAKPPTP